MLPQHGIRLVELDYKMFECGGRKRLRRVAADEHVVRSQLAGTSHGRAEPALLSRRSVSMAIPGQDPPTPLPDLPPVPVPPGPTEPPEPHVPPVEEPPEEPPRPIGPPLPGNPNPQPDIPPLPDPGPDPPAPRPPAK